MNEYFFYALVMSYLLLIGIKIVCSTSYFRALRKSGTGVKEADYTIVQPILSGDPALERRLQANLEQTTEMQFLWLIDRSDSEAQSIAKHILKTDSYAKRTNVLIIDEVPQQVNPKVFKLKQALSRVETEYLIVLDDDSIIDQRYMDEMQHYEDLEEEWIVTGIPYNEAKKPVYAHLVAAFVNSQSYLTYFGMAFLNRSYTINGMFYIGKTTLFKRHDAFKAIENLLCDDYEIAKYLRGKGVRLIQSTIPCQVQTTVSSFIGYISLMKRWLVFSNHYMRENLSPLLLIYIMIPSILPIVLLVWALNSNWLAVIVAIVAILIKGFLNQAIRKKVFNQPESIIDVLAEAFSDILLPVLYVYALLRPHTIQWRSRKISIKGQGIRYE